MDIIIGAGITGLAYAGFTGNDYLLLERDAETGGYCKTVRQDGFVWDYAGHFFHFQHKELEDYVFRYVPAEDVVRREKRCQIYYNKRYIDFPFQKNIHQLEQGEFIDCLCDLFDAPSKESGAGFKSFKTMLYGKFGKAIAEKFLIPYNEKLYACDLDVLDVNAMGRFFPYANREEIIRNFRKADNASYNSVFTYPRNGAAEYVKSLYTRLDGKKVSLNERVVSIDRDRKLVTTNRRTLPYDNVVSTIPFPALLDMCGMRYDTKTYSWNKVLVFNLGFDRKGEDKVNNWVYFPDKSLPFYRVGYYDNILGGERMSLYVELGFHKDSGAVDIGKYKEMVLDGLRTAGVVTEQKLIAWHYVMMDPAYVHITAASIADVGKQKTKLAEDNVYSIGRYGSWTYCSIEDNILEAKSTAAALSRDIQ